MKKIIVCVCIVLLCVSSLSASFDYKLDLISLDPIYKEYIADRETAGMTVNMGYVFEGYPSEIYQNYHHFPLGDPTKEIRNVPWIASYRLGETMTILKNTLTFDSFLSPVKIGISFAGSINNVLDGEFTDLFGFDGVYFYGINASVADMVSLRVGYNHHCTHYGDGVYFSLGEGSSVPSEVDEWFKYLRMNSVVVGLSIEPFDFLRVYGEINFNLENTDVRPYYFRPIWTNRGDGYADGVPESYGARQINFGLELQYPLFKKLGMTRLSYHGKALEEGKIVYKQEDLDAAGKTKPFYDENRPWEFEHSITLSQDLDNVTSLQVTYHNGRFLLNSFFSTRSSYVTFGVKFNFSGGIGLIDTSK